MHEALLDQQRQEIEPIAQPAATIAAYMSAMLRRERGWISAPSHDARHDEQVLGDEAQAGRPARSSQQMQRSRA